jgi:glucosamine 6-phosphate synthetase-like amidotransferase/phosphosugar isomerase protein
MSAQLQEPRAVDFVGSRAHLAAAAEGALILREACKIPTGFYSTRQYLHGPMEPLDERMLVVVIGDEREVTLAYDIARTGAHALLLTTADVAAQENLTVLRLPNLSPVQLAVLEILPIQLLAPEFIERPELADSSFRYEQPDTKVPIG